MVQNSTGSDLFEAVRQDLAGRLGEPFAWTLKRSSGRADLGRDAELVLTAERRTWTFDVELKKDLPPVTAMRMTHARRSRTGKRALLVVAPSVGPRAREILGGAKISWLEVGGDCEIAFGPVLIRMTSGRPRRRPVDAKARRVADLFQGKALDIVRILLTPPLRDWKLKDMAHAAGVSTPFVGRVFRTLALDAFVQRQRGATRVSDPGGLLDAWAKATPPPQRVVQFVHVGGPMGFLEGLAARGAGPRYALTAEAAADQIAPYARFSQVELYVESAEDWRKSLREVPRGGNVLLIESEDRGVFDGIHRTRDLDLVSSPQLYVDLFRRGGAAREAAEFFRKQVQPWTETPERTREG